MRIYKPNQIIRLWWPSTKEKKQVSALSISLSLALALSVFCLLKHKQTYFFDKKCINMAYIYKRKCPFLKTCISSSQLT